MGRLGRTRSRAVLLTRLLPFFFCRHLNAFNSDVCGCIVQPRKKSINLKKKSRFNISIGARCFHGYSSAGFASGFEQTFANDPSSLTEHHLIPLQSCPCHHLGPLLTPVGLSGRRRGTRHRFQRRFSLRSSRAHHEAGWEWLSCAGRNLHSWCQRGFLVQQARILLSGVLTPLPAAVQHRAPLYFFFSCEPCSGDESLRAAICSASGPDALGMGTTYETALGRPQNPYSCTG